MLEKPSLFEIFSSSIILFLLEGLESSGEDIVTYILALIMRIIEIYSDIQESLFWYVNNANKRKPMKKPSDFPETGPKNL